MGIDLLVAKMIPRPMASMNGTPGKESGVGIASWVFYESGEKKSITPIRFRGSIRIPFEAVPGLW